MVSPILASRQLVSQNPVGALKVPRHLFGCHDSVMLIPKSRRHQYVFLLFLVLFALSCISPPYPRHFILQHIPTIAAIVALVIVANRLRISVLSYTLLLLFLLLHVLGARYSYSYVPYDTWTESLFGVNLTHHFDFTRNHYDRLVHFLFGLLVAIPAYRFQLRFLNLRPFWASVFAIQFIMAMSVVYELAEWLVALTFAPEWADDFNGQQGDNWDPQKDMSLAALGAVMSMGLVAVVNFGRKVTQLSESR